MTTVLDDTLPAKLKPAIEKYGKVVTFRTYPNRVEDESESSVSLGTPVDILIKATPPDMAQTMLDRDGTGIEVVAKRILLVTLSGTADAISFVPEIGFPVIIDSASSQIVKVVPIYSGELIAAYEVFLEL